MTTNYFATAKTVEEIKFLFRNLAMEHHPDRGGDEAIMKEINSQYHEALKVCHGQASETEEGDEIIYKYKAGVETELMEKLLELLKFRSLTIELIGYWIWVSGYTKPHKEAMKAAGLRWHSGKKIWYYKPQCWKN